MVEIAGTEFPFHFFLGGVILFVMLAFLFVQAGDFTQQGMTTEAALLNTASNAFLTMMIATMLAIILVQVGIAPKVRQIISFGKNSTETMAIGIVLGMVLWTLLLTFSPTVGGAQSVFELNPGLSVFSQAGAVVSEFWQLFIVDFAAPFAEELAFLAGMPLMGFVLLTIVGDRLKLSFLLNPFVQIVIIIAIVAPTFAFFHVSQQDVATFILSAIVFRTILLGLVVSDVATNLVPFATLTFGFGVGVHHANNIIATGGYANFFSVMAQGASGGSFLFSLIWGWIVILYFVLAFVFAGLAGLRFLGVRV